METNALLERIAGLIRDRITLRRTCKQAEDALAKLTANLQEVETELQTLEQELERREAEE